MAKANQYSQALNQPWGVSLDASLAQVGAASGPPVTREYRVKPVLRYIITEHVEGGVASNSGSRALGEYDNRELAWVVAEGIAKANGGFAIIPNREYRALAAKLQEEYGVVG